jgi:hypothetical protein
MGEFSEILPHEDTPDYADFYHRVVKEGNATA